MCNSLNIPIITESVVEYNMRKRKIVVISAENFHNDFSDCSTAKRT